MKLGAALCLKTRYSYTATCCRCDTSSKACCFDWTKFETHVDILFWQSKQLLSSLVSQTE